jgi:hypothetical protein
MSRITLPHLRPSLMNAYAAGIMTGSVIAAAVMLVAGAR